MDWTQIQIRCILLQSNCSHNHRDLLYLSLRSLLTSISTRWNKCPSEYIVIKLWYKHEFFFMKVNRKRIYRFLSKVMAIQSIALVFNLILITLYWPNYSPESSAKVKTLLFIQKITFSEYEYSHLRINVTIFLSYAEHVFRQIELAAGKVCK